MGSIDPNQKVAGFLQQHPESFEVFKKYGCPDMRKGFFSLMARIMSIRNAAWIHGIPQDKLITDLEEVVEEKVLR